MSVLGNLLWFFCGGFFSASDGFWPEFSEYYHHWASGRKAVLQIAALAAWPFGKEIVYGGGAGSLILNIIWMIITGIPMALESVILGALLCGAIIGDTFPPKRSISKMAKLALMPFGAQIIYT